MKLFKILNSSYCKFVFILSLIISYFLIPYDVFVNYTLLAFIFMIVFSLTLTCVIRNIVEKIKLEKHLHHSILGIIAGVIGISALQVCGLGGVCAATLGTGIVSLIFPGVLFNLLNQYSVYIIITSILIQLIVLYIMKCFKR